VTDQLPAEPYRQTQRIALYPAQHPALLALPLLSAVLKTCLPPSRIQKPARSLQIHSNASYGKESETEAVAITTAGGVYTSINGVGQSQHPLISSLTHDLSCICNGQTPGALRVEQTAVYECKRLGDSKLCNATCCESVTLSPTLADNRDVLEHRYAAKHHLVLSIQGTHKGDLERGMLGQQPTVDITRSNRYQVRAQVDKVKSRFIQSVRDNIAEVYDLHRFESAAEHLEFIDSLLADNKYLFPVAELVEGGVQGPNPRQRESKADNEWLASTLLPGGGNHAVYVQQIVSSGE